MPTVAFDLFELDACGVSAAEMTTDVVQNNGVLSDTVKTMRAITKRLLTSDCTSTTRRPAQAAVGRWWRWRTGRSGKAPKGALVATDRRATLAAALGFRDQGDRRGSDLSRATNASRSIGFRK